MLGPLHPGRGGGGAQPAGAEVGWGGRAKEVGEETRRPEALREPSEEVCQGYGVRTHLGHISVVCETGEEVIPGTASLRPVAIFQAE